MNFDGAIYANNWPLHVSDTLDRESNPRRASTGPDLPGYNRFIAPHRRQIIMIATNSCRESLCNSFGSQPSRQTIDKSWARNKICQAKGEQRIIAERVAKDNWVDCTSRERVKSVQRMNTRPTICDLPGDYYSPNRP